MHSVLLAIAKWLEGTPWGVMTRESIWAYPFVQLTHFTGLSIWLGTNFALDLRCWESAAGVRRQRKSRSHCSPGTGLASALFLRAASCFLRPCYNFHCQHRV